jgi:arsenite methyltransferase
LIETEHEVRKAVKERYSKLATSDGSSECCNESESCCGSSLITIGDIPKEASEVYAGCGSPLSLISPKKGDVVLDLGSGGGIDVFRASQLVGTEGRAIGVDATPEMVWRARETKEKYRSKYANAEFRLGEIEQLPIESNSVHYVISNCVINLSPDKQRVLNEAFRVLKPGGTFAVADITLDRPISDTARKDMDSWSRCISGAIQKSEYRKILTKAGFVGIEIESAGSQTDKISDRVKVSSSHIRATKPD